MKNMFLLFLLLFNTVAFSQKSLKNNRCWGSGPSINLCVGDATEMSDYNGLYQSVTLGIDYLFKSRFKVGLSGSIPQVKSISPIFELYRRQLEANFSYALINRQKWQVFSDLSLGNTQFILEDADGNGEFRFLSSSAKKNNQYFGVGVSAVFIPFKDFERIHFGASLKLKMDVISGESKTNVFYINQTQSYITDNRNTNGVFGNVSIGFNLFKTTPIKI
jgi:hypothetical protein